MRWMGKTTEIGTSVGDERPAWNTLIARDEKSKARTRAESNAYTTGTIHKQEFA